jgi:hypothetical protein
MWQIKRWVNQAGWVGITGISLLIFSATFYLSAVMPDQARIAELQQTSISLRQQAHEALAQSNISTTDDMATQLKKFYHFFPADDNKNATLAKIYSAAEHQTLILETGEYRYISNPNSKLSRYQITLPIKGSYLQIRNFVNEILAKIPSASVDDISFKRESIGSPTLDARIKLTLFFGDN